ncbi:hypothetical protein L7F22_038500 [Adiantum nelumboides]|nr:hypothetical protein [Adiantum nelumboides]
MAVSSATALSGLSSTHSAFINNDLISRSCTSTAARCSSGVYPLRVSIVRPVGCHSGKDELVRDAKVMGRRAAVASHLAIAGGLALLMTTNGAEAAMQKVEGTRRDTQDAVTRGLREPSQLSSAKTNTVKEAGRLNTQASGGTILGAPRFEEPGGAYRSPQSQTEKSFDKRSTPAGVLQNRPN